MDQSIEKNNNELVHSESGIFGAWPKALGGTYVSEECECNGPYINSITGDEYYWWACKTKSLWGLNDKGWDDPFISDQPCMQ